MAMLVLIFILVVLLREFSTVKLLLRLSIGFELYYKYCVYVSNRLYEFICNLGGFILLDRVNDVRKHHWCSIYNK